MTARPASATPTAVDTARAAWGGALPDWVEVLARACAERSQAAVARDLGRSGAVVSAVLNNRYGAETTRIEERVRGLFMAGQVACPALGELSTIACQDWREKARVFEFGNPLRRQMFRACHCCPRFTAEKEKAE